ncbi:MAG: BatD family protein [Bacteroidota bacterium]
MQRRPLHTSLCLLLMAPLFMLNTASAQKFVAFVDRNKVPVNQPFQVSFQLENAQSRQIEFPDFEPLQVVAGPNSSSSMQIVNGQVSQTMSYSFYLRGAKEGKFTIGKATIKVGDKTLATEPISVEIVAGAANPQGGNNQTQNVATNQQNTGSDGVSPDLMRQIRENVFVRAIPSKSNVMQGEQFSVTFKLYMGATISGLNLVESPSFKSFWVEEINTENAQPKAEIYNGKRFNVATIKKVILFPQRSGKLTIDKMKLEANIKVRGPRRRSQSIFDSFFETYQDVPFEFSSSPVSVNVKALPSAGRPADFSGAVGSYTLDVTLDKNETETGEPVTMKVNLKGKGNIKTLETPKLDFPPDFEVYDPQVADKFSKSGGVISGSKTFDFLIIPRNPGNYKLPQVSWSYYDLAKGRYVSLQSDSYNLQVSGEAQEASNAPLVTQKEDIELIGQDIRYIMTEGASLQAKGESFIDGGLFWLLYLLPFVGFAGLWWLKQRSDTLAADVAGTRSRKANKVAEKRLSKARKFQQENEEGAFYKEISQVVWGYLADKLALGQSSLSRQNIKELLTQRGISQATIDRITGLLDTSEMALFAPASAKGGMSQLMDETTQLITDLESEWKQVVA